MHEAIVYASPLGRNNNLDPAAFSLLLLGEAQEGENENENGDDNKSGKSTLLVSSATFVGGGKASQTKQPPPRRRAVTRRVLSSTSHTCRMPCLLARELAEDSIELDDDDSAMSALLGSSSFSLVKSVELGKPDVMLSFPLPPLSFSLQA